MFKKDKKCCFIWKLFRKLLGIAFIAFAAIFAIFWFDLDGKLMFYVVEPFLKKHYDNMERKDTLKAAYDITKYPKYEYDV